MSRWSLHILTLALTVLPAPLFAQGGASEVLVFGDVSNSGIFTLKQPTSLNDVVSGTGGLSAGTANVRVIRNQQTVWGGYLSATKPGNFNVAHGDIIVVHSLERSSGRRVDGEPPEAQITVIDPATRPLIVTVAAGQVPVSAVLKEARLSDRGFTIIRTDPKAPELDRDRETILAHGDIVMVAAASVQTQPTNTHSADARPVITARVTQTANQEVVDVPPLPDNGPLLIPVSEQVVTPLEQPQIIDDSEPVPVAANYGMASPAMPSAPAMQTSPPPTLAVQSPSTGGNDDLLNTEPWMLGQSAAPIGQPPSPANNGMEIPPFNPQSGYNAPPAYNAPNGSQTAYNLGQSAAPGLPGGQNGLPPRPATQATQTEITAGSLPLPSELDAVVEESSSSTMWYVAGLAGALFVVLGAWVYGSRAMAETPQIRPGSHKRPVSRHHSPTVKHPPVTTDPSIKGPKVAAPVVEKPATPTIKPIAAAAGVVAGTATAAVAGLAKAVEPVSNVAEKVVAAVPDVPVVPQPEAPASVPQFVPVQPSAGFVAPTPAAQPVAAAYQPPVAPVPVPAIDPKPIPAVQEPVPVPATATTRILDALINNSIPVSEKPVQLPVHLDFFGDSNGPEKLRIDPAQPALRGPHTNVRAGLNAPQTTAQSSSYDG